MIYSSFRAMGTEVEIWGDRPDQESAVRDLFEEVEAVCSRFRPDSELSLINADTSVIHPLSPLLAEVVEAADRARSETDGLVDIGVGAAVADWGYARTFAEVTDLARGPDANPLPRWEVKGGTLVKSPETRIDLGGIAKGWTCDRAVERGLCLVASAGGDMRSSHPETTASVLDPGGNLVARVRVGRGALATSSVGKRRWRVEGREVSHLMDPRSMTPVETPVVSATVVAATAVEAEAGAKAVLLLGEEGLAWADEQDWISAALAVWHDGSVFATAGLEVAA